jgi:RNA polymerase sigma-70 factor (ECF subfamily)
MSLKSEILQSGVFLNILTEKILLSRLKTNDRQAATKLIETNYEKVYAFLFRFCSNREIAQDLTQETFIKVWKAIDNFSGNCRLSTWLYRISYNTYLDYLKKQKKEASVSENHDLGCKNSDSDFNNPNTSSEFSDNILDHIEQLSPILREIIVLHYREELSINEIADVLEIPRGTVKSRLNSALNALRNHLKK